MSEEQFNELKKDRRHRGGRHNGKDGLHQRGPKTFRRGRAIAFLEMMNLKRSTIKHQLNEPEFQSINQILIGELKAIDTMINEFVQLFEIHEIETKENATTNSNDEKGNEIHETN